MNQYQYIRAEAIISEFDGRYIDVNIINETMIDIFANYVDVRLYLNQPGDLKEVTLMISDLPSGLAASSLTLSNWLISNGTTTLPTTNIDIDVEYNYVTAYNVAQLGFNITPINTNYHITTTLTSDMEKDILLTRPGADYTSLNDNCLFTVGGYIYNSHVIDEGIVVKDCVVDSNISNDKSVGILNFSEVGKITKRSIREGDIKSTSTNPLSSGVYINVDAVELENKTPMLVLNGILIGSELISIVSTGTIKFDISRYDLVSHYLRLTDLTDTGTIGIQPTSGGGYTYGGMVSDQSITNMLLEHNSFIVLIDNADIYDDTICLSDTGIHGHHVHPTAGNYPLRLKDGRILSSYVHKERNGYVYYSFNAVSPNRMIHTTDYISQGYISKTLVYDRPYMYDAHLVMLRSKKINI